MGGRAISCCPNPDGHTPLPQIIAFDELNALSCYIAIIYKPGVRESEHVILANLLSPHTGLLKLNLLGKSFCKFFTLMNPAQYLPQKLY